MMFPARQHPRGSAIRRALQMRWSPLTLAPYWWFDMAVLSSLTFSGATTTAWADRSGNGRNTALGTSLNNQPFVFSPEVGDRIVNNHYHVPGTALPSTMPITIFAVWTPGTGNASDPYTVLGGAAGGVNLRFENSTYRASVLRSAQAMILSSTLVAIPGRRNIIGCVLQTSGTIVHLNGREESNGTNASISAVTAAIGLNTNNGESPGANAQCHEFLAWSGRALTQVERNIVSGYLAWKWAVELQSAGHPYRNRAPMMRPGWNDRRRLSLYLNVPPAAGGGGGARRRTSIVSSF